MKTFFFTLILVFSVQGFAFSFGFVYNIPAFTDECGVWAFGEGYGELPFSMLDEAWNERHGELFMVKGSDNAIEVVEKIQKACNCR